MHLTLYSYTVCTSVARPASPMKSLSPIGKIFWKSVVTSCAWTPNLRSDAIATHSFPRIAMTAPPLYDIIDYGKMIRQQNLFKIEQLHFSIQSVQISNTYFKQLLYRLKKTKLFIIISQRSLKEQVKKHAIEQDNKIHFQTRYTKQGQFNEKLVVILYLV